MTVVVLFNKPYGVHSQFRKDNEQMRTLADYIDDKSLRAVGRLDKDSEGLLLLTDNGSLNHAIATPDAGRAKRFAKTYLVQVENTPTAEQLRRLATGVTLKDGKTLPAIVEQVADDALPIVLWERNPPIRERQQIPTAWLKMAIFEGKNRQVRRMVAHVGLPCLRLIRLSVGDFSLVGEAGQLASGELMRLELNKLQLQALGVADVPCATKPARPSYAPKQPSHAKAKKQQAPKGLKSVKLSRLTKASGKSLAHSTQK